MRPMPGKLGTRPDHHSRTLLWLVLIPLFLVAIDRWYDGFILLIALALTAVAPAWFRLCNLSARLRANDHRRHQPLGPGKQ